jgi:hypothetical protein
VRCYLNIADRHCGDNDAFRIPEDRDENIFGKPDVEYFDRRDEIGNKFYIKPSEIRRRIAKKAMKELIINFFKKHLPEEGKELNGNWAVGIVKAGLLADLQYFFRVEEKYDMWRMTNLMIGWWGSSSDEKIVISFILNLAKFLWEWKALSPHSYWSEQEQSAYRKVNAEFQIALDQAKPWMIEVLAGLGKLDILSKYLLKLDEESLNKLKEIALRTKLDRHKHPVNKDRLVEGIEEAVYSGSAAAALLTRHASVVKTDEKLRKVQETENQKREIEERLSELQSGK